MGDEIDLQLNDNEGDLNKVKTEFGKGKVKK